MEMLWDLQIINDMQYWLFAENGKRGRLKAFLCISALNALADYSALAATT